MPTPGLDPVLIVLAFVAAVLVASRLLGLPIRPGARPVAGLGADPVDVLAELNRLWGLEARSDGPTWDPALAELAGHMLRDEGARLGSVPDLEELRGSLHPTWVGTLEHAVREASLQPEVSAEEIARALARGLAFGKGWNVLGADLRCGEHHLWRLVLVGGRLLATVQAEPRADDATAGRLLEGRWTPAGPVTELRVEGVDAAGTGAAARITAGDDEEGFAVRLRDGWVELRWTLGERPAGRTTIPPE